MAIQEDLRAITGMLNMRYPNYVSGSTIYRVVLGISTEYTKHRMLRDLTYLVTKGLVEYRSTIGIDVATITVNDCAFRLTARGYELANRLADDPALEL